MLLKSVTNIQRTNQFTGTASTIVLGRPKIGKKNLNFEYRWNKLDYVREYEDEETAENVAGR